LALGVTRERSPPARYFERQRAAEEQMDEIPGTNVFTGERSRRGYRLNKMAMSLGDPGNRARFRADETGYMTGMELGAAEQDAVGRRDWSGLLAQGGNIYLMLKLAATVGQNLGEMQAQMRAAVEPATAAGGN
jgi:protocatechuate 4,5-dioxygenase, alpha chain